LPLVLANFPFWLTAILTALFLFICLLMILTVLIQRPAGGGLSGAFGSGAGSGQTAFGAKTGDALTWATIGIFIIYLLFAIVLNFATRPPSLGSIPPAVGAPGSGAAGATSATGAAPATGAPPSTGAAPASGATPPAPTGATGATTPTGGVPATGPTPATTPPAPPPAPAPGPTGATGPT